MKSLIKDLGLHHSALRLSFWVSSRPGPGFPNQTGDPSSFPWALVAHMI